MPLDLEHFHVHGIVRRNDEESGLKDHGGGTLLQRRGAGRRGENFRALGGAWRLDEAKKKDRLACSKDTEKEWKTHRQTNTQTVKQHRGVNESCTRETFPCARIILIGKAAAV